MGFKLFKQLVILFKKCFLQIESLYLKKSKRLVLITW